MRELQLLSSRSLSYHTQFYKHVTLRAILLVAWLPAEGDYEEK
ncbi:hypothetical protein RIEGSTA812A_PEG_1258 [invertebrate metagenome]|uniref:Uncharacterized protein n=1 Tax=invertebrate metagenome TaxID=1711999 RepID=A0A484H8B1_9ZZZZ